MEIFCQTRDGREVTNMYRVREKDNAKLLAPYLYGTVAGYGKCSWGVESHAYYTGDKPPQHPLDLRWGIR